MPKNLSVGSIAGDSLWVSGATTGIWLGWPPDTLKNYIGLGAPLVESKPEPDTGYYEKEEWNDCGHPEDLVACVHKWKVNRALKEVVIIPPVDKRPVCQDVCPADGAILHYQRIDCPEGRLGCDVLHRAWHCDKCGKDFYYKGDPP